MRRHPCTRVFSALLALWWALTWADVGLVHSCPVHDGAAGTAPLHTAHAPSTGAPDAGHDSAGHGESPSDGHGQSCTCIGVCCAAAVAFFRPAVPVGASPAVVDAGAVPVPDALAAPRSRAAHALPFANGPPAGTPIA